MGLLHGGLCAIDDDFALATDQGIPVHRQALAIQMLELAAKCDYDVVVPRSNGRIQPYFAVYHKRTLPYMEEMLHRGHTSMIQLYRQSLVRYLDDHEWATGETKRKGKADSGSIGMRRLYRISFGDTAKYPGGVSDGRGEQPR